MSVVRRVRQILAAIVEAREALEAGDMLYVEAVLESIELDAAALAAALEARRAA